MMEALLKAQEKIYNLLWWGIFISSSGLETICYYADVKLSLCGKTLVQIILMNILLFSRKIQLTFYFIRKNTFVIKQTQSFAVWVSPGNIYRRISPCGSGTGLSRGKV